MCGLFHSQKPPRYDLGYCKLYDAQITGPCTKIELVSGSPSAYEFLRKSKSPLFMSVLKISKNSVYTQRLVPFSAVYDSEKREYNIYVMGRIKEAIDKLHMEEKLEHSAIDVNAIFVEESGHPVLGNFGSVRAFTDSTKDADDFDKLCQEITGIPTGDLSPHRVVFQVLEPSFLYSLSATAGSKKSEKTGSEKQERSIIEKPEVSAEKRRSLLIESLSRRECFIQISARYVVSLVIKEIKSTADQSYRSALLEGLFHFDRELLTNVFAKELFSILNSSVRLYLLTNLGSVTNLDSCIREICLGLYVKDKTMRLETVKYIFAHCDSMSYDSFARVLAAMQEITDSETIGVVCQNLSITTEEYDFEAAAKTGHSPGNSAKATIGSRSVFDSDYGDAVSDGYSISRTSGITGRATKMLKKALKQQLCCKMLYKLLLKYTTIGKARPLVYSCIEKHFMAFEKVKLSTELLPQLCSRLCDSDGQEQCFALVEKILAFLRQNKDEIRRRDWSLTGLKKMLVKGSEDPVQARIAQIEERSACEVNQWEEEELSYDNARRDF